jgi:DNA repair protein RadA/Sms
VVMGEIALSGEVRPIAHAGLRLKESNKLGFDRAWGPAGTDGLGGIALARFGKLKDLVDQILGR